MAEETKTTAAAPATTTPEVPPAAKVTEDVVGISDVPVAEKPVAVTAEKEQPSVPEPEPEAAQKPAAAAVEEEKPTEDEKIAESASFKEETNVAGELPDPQKKALDEFKLLVQEALNKHEFTAPPAPPAADKKAEDAVAEAPEEKAAPTEEAPKSEVKIETRAAAEVAAAVPVETEKATPAVETPEPVVVPEVVEKVTAVDDDGAKTVEAIAETIVAVSPPAPPTEEQAPTTEAPPAEAKEPEAPASPPPPPEEVSIWGIPLLADERSDVILLKFLRARDFKVKEALTMLKNTVRWRKEFGIEALLEEDFGTDLDKVAYLDGVDKEGHPVCYNAYGEFQSKELYQNTFFDEEKPLKFLRWRIQLLEKSIRKLDFSPDGICSFVQINDLKNLPGPFKTELRQTTNQALVILQDNYPEFVAKQVFINVPWWYLAFYRLISPFFTLRTKSKFVFAGSSKSAETLFKYISPEQVPTQYGGFSQAGEQEFSAGDSVTEETIKAAGKHTVEFPVTEASTFVWETRVVGWEVSYGAEFVPSAEDGYTVIIQKSRKISAADETVVSGSFKISEPGKVVLVFDNQSSKKKKLLYRTKTKPSTSD